MVEQTQSIPGIMTIAITDLDGAIAFWEYAANDLEQLFNPYLKHAQEVINMAREQGNLTGVIEQAELGMDAWRAPIARSMEMLSFLRGFDVPEEGVGPQYGPYDDALMFHYNRVVRTPAAAILFCENLYPVKDDEDERYQLARQRCLETATVVDRLAAANPT